MKILKISGEEQPKEEHKEEFTHPFLKKNKTKEVNEELLNQAFEVINTDFFEDENGTIHPVPISAPPTEKLTFEQQLIIHKNQTKSFEKMILGMLRDIQRDFSTQVKDEFRKRDEKIETLTKQLNKIKKNEKKKNEKK